ncbi:MAG: hypothetical protein IJ751_07075, partial [Oscillospiraceae bacterium]|nr:hypothetical protein [Oscillospiraceae bacterium]
ACPAGAITLAEGKVVIDRSRCDNCGRVKYDELGMPYPMGDAVAPLTDGDVAGLVDQLTSAGLRVQIGG